MRATDDPFLPGLTGSPDFQARLERAAAATGTTPRTRHLLPDGRPRFINRLVFETSPYLRQHAHNPVNWYPWGDEAFARASAEGKAVLLSVGYSTCHWCHVMEHESFEDEEIAEVLNRNFVAIKVDREERPDVDEVYMSVVQALTGQGGWPMTVIMNAAREPFLAGTYFPARDGDRPGSRGFLPLLELVVRTRANKPHELERSAKAIAEAVANFNASPPPDQDELDPALARAPAEALLSHYDPVWGGFGAAPKFPRPVTLDFLFRHAASTGDRRAAEAALHTLDRMTTGGLHDHIGGGFHRYSVDERWLVPHFEKMLYDNAQIVCALLDAQQWSGEARYGEVARKTLDALLAEMQAEHGGFYSATDADSLDPTRGEREEGWFFTWTEDEIDAALPPELASAAKAWFATTPGGNFEGRNQLHTPRAPAEVARQLGIDEATLADRIENARARLYAVRSRRPPPLRDDKILASWNGLVLSAFARAAFVLNEPRYREAAERTAAFLLEKMRDHDGRMLRVYAPGRPPQRGFLDDHAFVVQGLLDLFEATSDPRVLDEARAIQAVLDQFFRDPIMGAYFTTPDDGEPLLVRVRPEYDGAEPSGNSITALNLLRLAAYGDDETLRHRADGIFAAQAGALEQHPHALPKLASALGRRFARTREVFIVANDLADAAPLVDVLRSRFLPHEIVAIVSEATVQSVASRVPGLEGKHALGGRATAYVCEFGACQRPTTDPVEFAQQLGA